MPGTGRRGKVKGRSEKSAVHKLVYISPLYHRIRLIRKDYEYWNKKDGFELHLSYLFCDFG